MKIEKIDKDTQITLLIEYEPIVPDKYYANIMDGVGYGSQTITYERFDTLEEAINWGEKAFKIQIAKVREIKNKMSKLDGWNFKD